MRKVSEKSTSPGRIRLIVTDVDGVWTSGDIFLDDAGREIKRFSVYDGLAVVLARRVGLKVAILSARECPAVSVRAKQLNLDAVRQGSQDKARDLKDISLKLGIGLDQTLYVGDDLTDLGAFRCAAIAVSVPNAPSEVWNQAHWVTESRGGSGAIREIVEWVLREQGRWEEVVKSYEESAEGSQERRVRTGGDDHI